MPRLSVIIIALNQEANIGDCLASVSFADDIVVVDTGSTDRTVELARAYTDRVLTTDWQGFGRTKNYALDQARGDWVFSLDTDERVPPALQAEILATVAADGPLDGYRVARKNYFCGRWIRHLGWYPDYTLRLFRRDRGRFRDREVHEEVVVDGPRGDPQDPLGALQLPERQRLRRPHGPLRPPGRPGIGQGGAGAPARENYSSGPCSPFSISTLSAWGFSEGTPGYTLALLMSMYKFLKYYYLRELARGRDLDGH